MLYFYFRDLKPEMSLAWLEHVKDITSKNYNIGVVSILSTKTDALVSPANSFGYMDGGIDLVYRNHFGMQIQRRLQEMIKRKYPDGELPIGRALIISTGDKRIPKIVAAPTMREPSVIQGTNNVYKATYAAVETVLEFNKKEPDKIESIAFPGMGTGVGMMDPFDAAEQMVRAIIDIGQFRTK